MRAAPGDDPPTNQSASGARARATAGCRQALLLPPSPLPRLLYRRGRRSVGDRLGAMARDAFAAAPLLAWTALLLACAVVDACPGRENAVIRSCTSRTECAVTGKSALTLALDATLSASCQWIVRMATDMYVEQPELPFNLTADGGCSYVLQMGSDDGGSHSAGSSACASSRLKTGYLFFRSGSIVAIQPTPLLLDQLRMKRPIFVALDFEVGSAVSLCEEAELEINETTFVRTSFLATSTTPCVTTLKAGTGRELSITVIDIWPNPAQPACACYERLTAEPGTVTCWSEPTDSPIVDRRINVTLNAAGEYCTVVLFAQVIERPIEFVTSAETQSVPSVPGGYVFPSRDLIIAISVTVGGGIVIILCVAAILVACKKRSIYSLRKMRLDHRLVPKNRSDGRSPEAADEPVYFELEDHLTYRGHLIRHEPVTCPKASTATDTEPGVKHSPAIAATASSRAAANGSSATNDYEEIGPFLSSNSAVS